MNMPKIDISKMVEFRNDEDRKIFNIVVKKDETIRASKPKVISSLTGKAAYVWRMVVFQVSPKGVHHCMPVCADFDLPAYGEDGKWSSSVARGMSKELDPLVDAIVNTIPCSRWYGINRWSRALGGN